MTWSEVLVPGLGSSPVLSATFNTMKHSLLSQMHTSPFPAFQPHRIPSAPITARRISAGDGIRGHRRMRATGTNLKQMGFRGRRRGPCASAITWTLKRTYTPSYSSTRALDALWHKCHADKLSSQVHLSFVLCEVWVDCVSVFFFFFQFLLHYFSCFFLSLLS